MMDASRRCRCLWAWNEHECISPATDGLNAAVARWIHDEKPRRYATRYAEAIRALFRYQDYYMVKISIVWCGVHGLHSVELQGSNWEGTEEYDQLGRADSLSLAICRAIAWDYAEYGTIATEAPVYS